MPAVQERLTTDIADALMETLAPTGVGVVIEAQYDDIPGTGISTHSTIRKR
jgi:GTP cyclohydrolase I